MYIDTHCHLFFDSFAEDLSLVIADAEVAGVNKIIVPCIDLKSSRQAINISEKYSCVYVAVGVHPNDLDSWDKNTTINILQDLLNSDKVVAIGEIGLDYYRNPSSALFQQKAFRAQLELAENSHKPVIIHERNSEEDLVKILNEYNVKGIFHGFMGSPLVQAYGLDKPFLFGLGGSITYKKRLLSDVSLLRIRNKIALETDAPFMAPVPFRGKRNEPKYIPHIASKIAGILDCDIMSISEGTSKNAESLFFL